MLHKMKSIKEKNEGGFTLIELLVVILVIGILAAIAIPLFLNQRKTANDGAVKSDVRNTIRSVEEWGTAQQDPKAAIPAAWSTPFTGSQTITTASGKQVKITLTTGTSLKVAGDLSHYTITGTNSNGDTSAPEVGGIVYDSVSGWTYGGSAPVASGPATTAPAANTTATCDNSTYTVTGAGTSISCVLSLNSGTTKNYTISITTTSTTPVEWKVNADWNGVANFKNAKGYSPTVMDDTGSIFAKTYAFGGTDRSWNADPAASNNYKYISASKGTMTFTAQVVTN